MSQPLANSDKRANTLDKLEYSRKSLRAHFRDKRGAISPSQQSSAAKAVLAQAIKYNLFANCKHVGLYLTNEGELDTQPLIEYLLNEGISVYLPVLHPFSKGYLVFLCYTPDTEMKPNKFGILEPVLNVTKLCPVAALDIIFTPLVAFDEQGNRMGMGGGFYDRTLAQITHSNSNRKTKLIGLAHDEQKAISLPTQVWDIPLPTILTPSTLYSF